MEKLSNSSFEVGILNEFNVSNTAVLAGSLATVEAIAIKPICENLNLDYSWQYRRLQDDASLSQLLLNSKAKAGDGKMREMVCLPPEALQQWLWAINRTEKMNVELWDEYRKNLVWKLTAMLRVAMDEYAKLKEELFQAKNYITEIKEDMRLYIEDIDSAQELKNQMNLRYKTAKSRKEKLLEKLNSGYSTLYIPFENN